MSVVTKFFGLNLPDVLEPYFTELQTENAYLKSIIEEQHQMVAVSSAVITRIESQFSSLITSFEDIKDELAEQNVRLESLQTEKVLGLRQAISKELLEEAGKMNNTTIRKLIYKVFYACGSYDVLFEKLKVATGFDVYSYGKTKLGKKDGVEGWKKDPSFINTILKHGKAKEAGAICLSLLRD